MHAPRSPQACPFPVSSITRALPSIMVNSMQYYLYVVYMFTSFFTCNRVSLLLFSVIFSPSLPLSLPPPSSPLPPSLSPLPSGYTIGGNNAHLSPEVLNAKPGPGCFINYTKQPVWTAGVLAHELAGGYIWTYIQLVCSNLAAEPMQYQPTQSSCCSVWAL